MALTRRSVQRMSGSIWPGFVDAMTALLLVLMFVLTIFMILQYALQETITGQESELDELAGEVTTLAQALGLEQQRVANLEDESAQLSANLDAARTQAETQATLIATLSNQIAAQEAQLADNAAQITSFEAQVATLLSQRDTALGERDTALAERDAARDEGARLTATVAELEDAQSRLISDQEALQLALAQARDEIDVQAEEARLAAARREALEALTADLQAEAEATELALSEVEAARLVDAAAAEALRERLANADAELTAMTLALEEERRQAEETLTLLAAAQAAEEAAAENAGRQLTEAEERAALLAVANEALEAEEAKSAEGLRRIALLNQQLTELRTQLSSLQAVIDEGNARDQESQVQIEALGSQLNTALARAAAEQRRRAELEEAERLRLEEEARLLEAEAQDLEQYRSEFFGELRAVLGDVQGIEIVGDRFLFSSEVLFESASADLAPAGRNQITSVSQILLGVAGEIPQGLDWILRVDGHTDNIPLQPGAEFADNWELSQARALSVVRFMTEELGFPPNRLLAAGFGEYRPVNPAGTPQALAQNRRIELKLTER
ncbi:MAG: peptidoglycan -binding protein [Pseudomonadota bacterium]